MLVFISRRLIAGLLVLFVASFIVYILMSKAGDPLAFIAEIQNEEQRIAIEKAVRDGLNLDTPVIGRFFLWLRDLFTGEWFGISARTQLPIGDDLRSRIPVTLKLVGAATILSMVVGTTVGVVTAIRQYSGFDYLVTFFTFVFFSLPSFWVGVILKDIGGIQFNDWLRDSARFSPAVLVGIGVVAFILIYTSAGGEPRRKLAVAAIGTGVIEAVLIYVSATEWLRNPGLGPVVTALFAVLIALGLTAVMAGLRNVKARNTALTTAAIGAVLWFPLQIWLDDMSFWKLLLFAVVSIGVGVGVGYAWGGFDKGLSGRIGGLTAFLISIVIFVDRAMQSWDDYASNSVIRNRPIKTIGDRETRLEGDFWQHVNDTFGHIILPTMVLMLISVATYTRYSRSSMLEVFNQDYMRTARSKGLTERTIIVRHGLRNALIPLATVMTLDISGVLGGAVITETVFEWNGMGRMFIDALRALDPNPVMAFLVITAGCAIVFNIIADLLYAVLDPRIRIT
ncbi:ABC transporter permease [Desertimonas flava]|uniref:ABC transporter permease n=1 Tax=Desertimonas flava TaxID=2064846 RepID=UPI000E350FB4|nr:ABC transporter permease [Desertimonas flava]